MACLCTLHPAPSPSAILITSRTTVTWPAITYFPGPFLIQLFSYFGRNVDIEACTRADRLLEAADRMRGSRGEVAEGLVRSDLIFLGGLVRFWLNFYINHSHNCNHLDLNRLAETHQASLAQYLEPRGYDTVLSSVLDNNIPYSSHCNYFKDFFPTFSLSLLYKEISQLVSIKLSLTM